MLTVRVNAVLDATASAARSRTQLLRFLSRWNACVGGARVLWGEHTCTRVSVPAGVPPQQASREHSQLRGIERGSVRCWAPQPGHGCPVTLGTAGAPRSSPLSHALHFTCVLGSPVPRSLGCRLLPGSGDLPASGCWAHAQDGAIRAPGFPLSLVPGAVVECVWGTRGGWGHTARHGLHLGPSSAWGAARCPALFSTRLWAHVLGV